MKVPGIPYIQGRNYAANPAGRHYGIAVHCTASTATARQEAAYATRRTDGIGSHFYVDGVEAIQSIDTIYKVNHAGSANGNNNAICLEQTGRNDWTREHWLSAINWGQMSYALATVISAELVGFQVRRASIAEMKANPKVAAFYSHDDMRQAWGGTSHTDPGPNYPWDKLFASVNAALSPSAPTGETDMLVFVHKPGDPADRIWRCNGVTRTLVAPDKMANTGYTMAGLWPGWGGALTPELSGLVGPTSIHAPHVTIYESDPDLFGMPVDCVCECDCGEGDVPEHSHTGSATTSVSIGDVIHP